MITSHAWNVVYYFFHSFLKIYLFILCIWVHCSCTDGCERSGGCWELNSGPLFTPARLLWSNDLFIVICEYTVAVFRHTRRVGCELGFELRTFRKSSRCSYLLSHLSSPISFILMINSNIRKYTEKEVYWDSQFKVSPSILIWKVWWGSWKH